MVRLVFRRRVFGDGPVAVSNGSGFIVKSDGLILTNAHVVVQHYGHNAIRVRLTDGRIFMGTLQNVDMKSDIASIRINAVGLSSVEIKPTCHPLLQKTMTEFFCFRITCL